MKRFFLLLILLGFLDFSVRAQEKNPKAPTSKTAKAKTQKDKKVKMSKAGKSNPKEKGSGMTVPIQDQPNLDKKPNPASTVPSREIPADNDGRPTP